MDCIQFFTAFAARGFMRIRLESDPWGARSGAAGTLWGHSPPQACRQARSAPPASSAAFPQQRRVRLQSTKKKELASIKKGPFRGLLLCSRCLPLHDLKNTLLQQTRPAFAFPLANRRKVMAAETPSDTTGASQMPVSPKSAANSIPISVIPTEPRNKDKNCEYFGNSIAEK